MIRLCADIVGTPVNPDNPYTYGGTPQNMDEGANGLGIASMILGIVAILLHAVPEENG